MREEQVIDAILAAVRHTRRFILSIFLTYVASSAVGIGMAHVGNGIALAERDRIVQKALTSAKASMEYRSGDRAKAALHDFAGNLFYAALPQTVAGFGVVLPYFSVAYQGWIGGIVSVDGTHRSRLRTLRGATYYIGVLLLQFIPFSLSIGAGVRCGVDLYRHNGDVGWRMWRYRLPRQSLVDLGWVIALTIPLFLVASAFEFLSPWNG
jgi:hypothetical protein